MDRNVSRRDSQGRKLCSKCRVWKDTVEFSSLKKEDDGLNTYCKGCVKLWSRTSVLKKYGLTEKSYAALLARQGGVCALCLKPPTRAFDIDHDHSCCPVGGSCGECVRGLLCFNCNSALGKFHDDVDTLSRAVTYLTQTSS